MDHRRSLLHCILHGKPTLHPRRHLLTLPSSSSSSFHVNNAIHTSPPVSHRKWTKKNSLVAVTKSASLGSLSNSPLWHESKATIWLLRRHPSPSPRSQHLPHRLIYAAAMDTRTIMSLGQNPSLLGPFVKCCGGCRLRRLRRLRSCNRCSWRRRRG